MKKLITGILATLTCLCCFTGCELLGKNSSSSSVETVSGVETAKDYLESSFKKDKNASTRKDYEVLSSYTDIEGVTYTITWSVNVTEGVTVVVGENGKVTIDVAEDLDADLAYKLTATLTDPNGKTASFTLNRTVEAAPTMVPSPIIEKPVEGTAYKYYVYQAYNEEDMYFTGAMDGYYFKTSENFEEGVDMFVEYLEDSETNFYLYFNNSENKKQYVGVVHSGNYNNIKYLDEPVCSFVYDEELGSITTTIVIDEEDTVFYLGTYDYHDTISASKIKYASSPTSYIGHLVTLVDRTTVTAPVKVEHESIALNTAPVYVGDTVIELPVVGTRYPDVAISYATTDSNVSVNGGNLTVSGVEATKAITVTATFTCGEETDTKDMEIKLVPNNSVDIIDALYNLDSGENFGNKVSLTGVVTSTSNLNEEKGSVCATIIVKGRENKVVGAYTMFADSTDSNATAKGLAVGDYITVTGTLTHYYSKATSDQYQFDYGCTFVKATAPDADKVAIESGLISFAQSYTKSTVINLPVAGQYFNDVTIDWESDNSCAVVDATENTLTITPASTVQEVTLTASITVGTNAPETVTYEFTVESITLLTISTAPVKDTAYIMYISQYNKKNTYYFNGTASSSNFFNTSTDLNQAVAVYFEPIDGEDGKYYMYIGEGENKKYVNGTYNLYLEAEPTNKYIWNATYSTMEIVGESSNSYIGTSGTYSTLNAAYMSKIENAGYFVAHFATLVSTPSITVEQKVAEELIDFTKKAPLFDIASDKTINVPVVGETFTDVTITWSSDNNTKVTIDNTAGTIKFVCGETAVDVVITATLKVGETTVETKNFNINIAQEKIITSTFADFNTMSANTSYSTYTSTDGWVVTNGQVFKGNSDGSNGNGSFSVIGDANARAICLNGKTSAVGTLVSPLIANGIKSLSFSYGIMAGDSKISATINVKNKAGDILASTTISDTTLEKYAAETFSWTLPTAVSGNFKIEIINNCPSNNTGNKDRLAIWNFTWVNA